MTQGLVIGTSRLECVAPCESGLEAALAEELRSLGCQDVDPTRRAVSFVADRRLLWHVNLRSRLANRVLVTVVKARVQDRDDLYSAISTVEWERVLTPEQTLAVDSRTSHLSLHREEFVNQLSKDAICDRLRRAYGRRPNVDRHRPDVPVHVHLVGDRATVLLDASGERLHRRGYRARAGAAPLKETLAAGLLALAGYDGQRPFIDPMCGSGTIAIEAALIARNIAPGLLRTRRGGAGFAFERWIGHDRFAFEREVRVLRDAVRPSCAAPIVASDRDRTILPVARENAANAFLQDDILFQVAELEKCVPPGEGALLITNPPYGERLGTPESARELHERIGDTLKKSFAGCTAWILCGEASLVGAVGLKPGRKVQLFNGPIACVAARFDLYSGTRRTPAPPQEPSQDVPAEVDGPDVPSDPPEPRAAE